MAIERTPSGRRAAALYDEGYARRYRAHDDEFSQSVPSQQLAEWIRVVSRRFSAPVDVLDLGCGTGRYFWALEGVRSLTGVDASAAMLQEARRPYRAAEIAAHEVTLVEGDVLTQRFAPHSFDLVYSIGVLAEHAPLTASLVANVATWLRPGGRFAFTTVHPESPSVPLTVSRRLASVAAPILPERVARPLRRRLLSGGMYADEAAIREYARGLFVIEDLDRFTSEAHLHVRAVLRKMLS
jgi:SAM-dependent methyltransferase